MNRFATLTCAIAALALPAAANAETILALSGSSITAFDSASPTTIISNLAINGVASGTTLLGIDARPANGLLYSVSSTGAIYSLTNTGSAYQATVVSQLNTTLAGTSFGIDFNPTVDRLRLISNTGQNLRINIETGAATVDGAINGPAGISITGSGYTNSFAGATSTTLYGIDSGNGTLVSTALPNAGTYTAVGSLGVTGLTPSGFDISGRSGIAYLSNANNDLYTVNLATGAATLTGNIGNGRLAQITGLAVMGTVPEPGTWMTMVMGFGAAGVALRRRRRTVAA